MSQSIHPSINPSSRNNLHARLNGDDGSRARFAEVCLRLTGPPAALFLEQGPAFRSILHSRLTHPGRHFQFFTLQA